MVIFKRVLKLHEYAYPTWIARLVVRLDMPMYACVTKMYGMFSLTHIHSLHIHVCVLHMFASFTCLFV